MLELEIFINKVRLQKEMDFLLVEGAGMDCEE
jgi:hypothetical protein